MLTEEEKLMTPMQKRALARKGEKLRRLAYELEVDANALRHYGAESASNGVRAMASSAGNIGRTLCDMAEA